MQCHIFGHVIENVPPGADFFRIGIGINPRQAAATVERIVADWGDGVGDSDARQAAAIVERPKTDWGDGVGNGDARQTAATPERPFADFGDGVADGDARQTAATRVSIISWLSVLYALNGRKVAMWILFRYEKVIFNVFNF